MISVENIWITLIEGVLSLAGICVTVIVTNRKNNKKLEEKVDKLAEHDKEQYLSLLRLTIMSNEMPIGERIVAGQKYLDLDGNGDVKKFLKEKFNIDKPVSEASHYKN